MCIYVLVADLKMVYCVCVYVHCRILRPPLPHVVADFDDSVITVTLSGPVLQLPVDIPIVDDRINEHQETFVGYIVTAEFDAIDPSTVQLGRNVTQLIINDNDSEYKESICTLYALVVSQYTPHTFLLTLFSVCAL